MTEMLGVPLLCAICMVLIITFMKCSISPFAQLCSGDSI